MTSTNLYQNCAIVIPAYNEANTIIDVANKALIYTPNVIIVNDASTDSTAALAQETKAIVISHAVNSGKAEALITGFNHAKSLNGIDFVVTLDGDGQHNPDNIPELIQAYEAYPNHLIIAARLNNRENAPKARLFANKFADFWVSWAASNKIVDSQSGFRLYPISLVSQIKSHYNKAQGFVFESEILIIAAKLGFKFAFVAIDSFYPEQRRASHFRPVFDITQITRMIASTLVKKALNFLGLIRYFFSKPIIIPKNKGTK